MHGKEDRRVGEIEPRVVLTLTPLAWLVKVVLARLGKNFMVRESHERELE